MNRPFNMIQESRYMTARQIEIERPRCQNCGEKVYRTSVGGVLHSLRCGCETPVPDREFLEARQLNMAFAA